MHEYPIGKAKFGEATFSQCCKHSEEELPALNPTPPMLAASRDLGLFAVRRTSGLVVGHSRWHHQVSVFCTHVPPTSTCVCRCVLVNRRAVIASWTAVSVCVRCASCTCVHCSCQHVISIYVQVSKTKAGNGFP